MDNLTALQPNQIVFPELGLEFTIDRVAFSIFGINIMWYGLFITLGVFLAVVYCFRRMKEFGIDSERSIDAFMGGFIGALICARAYYVIMEWDKYAGNIKAILSVRDGGLAIYGGLIGAVVFGAIIAKIRKVKIMPLLDLAGMGFFIGQAFGRWGNFFNQEAFGSNTDLPWGMSGGTIRAWLLENMDEIFARTGIVVSSMKPVHPCFLYESIWCLIGFVILHFYSKHRKFDGQLFLMYIGWYGLGRAFIESLRTDSLMIGNVRVSQAVAIVCVAASVILLIAIGNAAKRNGYVLYCNTEESKKLLEEAEKQYEESKSKKSKKTKNKKQSDGEYKALYEDEAENPEKADADDKTEAASENESTLGLDYEADGKSDDEKENEDG